jgi:hypothetical protein
VTESHRGDFNLRRSTQGRASFEDPPNIVREIRRLGVESGQSVANYGGFVRRICVLGSTAYVSVPRASAQRKSRLLKVY